MMLDNVQRGIFKGVLGKVQQKDTAINLVRVKWCGKSAPDFLVTRVAWQTPSGAKSNRHDRM